MRQRHDIFGISTPSAHCFPQPWLRRLAEMIALCVLTYQERQTHITQHRQQFRPPERRAFRPRRQIRAAHRTRVTKAHGRDRDAFTPIECRAIHAEPGAQSVARGIVPRHAAFMDTPPRRLTRDQNSRLGMDPNDGPRRMRQMLGAMAAVSDLRNQSVERIHNAAFRPAQSAHLA